MKVRVLAAAAVAVWSKTAAATTAAVLPGMVDQPASASMGNAASAASASAGNAASGATLCGGVDWGPGQPPPGAVGVAFKSSAGGVCVPGTLSLQATSDGTHWKTLASEHETAYAAGTLYHACLPGSWLYRGNYTTDDHSFKSISPQSFTC